LAHVRRHAEDPSGESSYSLMIPESTAVAPRATPQGAVPQARTVNPAMTLPLAADGHDDDGQSDAARANTPVLRRLPRVTRAAESVRAVVARRALRVRPPASAPQRSEPAWTAAAPEAGQHATPSPSPTSQPREMSQPAPAADAAVPDTQAAPGSARRSVAGLSATVDHPVLPLASIGGVAGDAHTTDPAATGLEPTRAPRAGRTSHPLPRALTAVTPLRSTSGGSTASKTAGEEIEPARVRRLVRTPSVPAAAVRRGKQAPAPRRAQRSGIAAGVVTPSGTPEFVSRRLADEPASPARATASEAGPTSPATAPHATPVSMTAEPVPVVGTRAATSSAGRETGDGASR